MSFNLKDKLNDIGAWLTFVLIVVVALMLLLILYLNILPLMLQILSVIGIPVIVVLLIIFMNRDDFIPQVISISISCILTIISIFMIIFMFRMAVMYHKIIAKNTIEDNYYIVAKKESMYDSFKDIFNFDLGVYNDESKIYKNALSEIESNTIINELEYTSLDLLKEALYNDSVDAILLNSVTKSYIEENDKKFTNLTKIVYTFKAKARDIDSISKVDTNKNIYNVYVSVVNNKEKLRINNDINLLLTINPKTKEMLVTNIPNDYYLKINDTEGFKERLSYINIYGIGKSVLSLEEMLNIDINYYIEISIGDLVDVLDYIGGIDIESDRTISTYANPNVIIKKGINNMNSEMAHAFIKEVYAYNNGYEQKLLNELDVLNKTIAKLSNYKVMSSKNSKVFEVLSKSIKTNMTKKELSNLFKLNNTKTEWQIAKYNLKGKVGSGYTHTFGEQNFSIIVPDDISVNNAKNNIKNMQNGKYLSELGI